MEYTTDSDIGGVSDYDLVVEDSGEEAPETRQEEHDPELKIKTEKTPERCSTCGNKISAVSGIDGECIHCAIKRLRKIESRLSQLNQLKPTRTYCCIEGHREAQKTPLFPEWDGHIIINGIKLQPVFPLCKDCLDAITSFLVYYLEQRGIMRKGNRDSKNEYGDPYGSPMTAADEHEAVQRLKEFVSVANIFVLDDKSSVNNVHRYIKERRGVLLRQRIKEAKKCLDEQKKAPLKSKAEADAQLLKSQSVEAKRALTKSQALQLLAQAVSLVNQNPELPELENLDATQILILSQKILDTKNLPFLADWSVDSVAEVIELSLKNSYL